MSKLMKLKLVYSDGRSLSLDGADARDIMEQIDLHIARSIRAREKERSMDSVWAVYRCKCRRGTYVVKPFNGYFTGKEPFLLVRAPTKLLAVEAYKSLI